MTYISSEMTQEEVAARRAAAAEEDRMARLRNVVRFAVEDALERGAISEEAYEAAMDALNGDTPSRV